MAPRNCSTCGKEVAVNARTCPHCGQNYPAPGTLFSVVYLLVAAPFLALGALLIYALIAAMLSSSPPPSAVPEVAPSVTTDTQSAAVPTTACFYSAAESMLSFSLGEANDEKLESLPCSEQHDILTVLARIPTKDIRDEEFAQLYESAVESNELGKETHDTAP